MPTSSSAPQIVPLAPDAVMDIGEELQRPTKLRPFIIEPLLREGETMSMVISEQVDAPLIVTDLAVKISGFNQALGFSPSPDYQTLWIKLDGEFPVLDKMLSNVLHTEKLHSRYQDIDSLNDYLNCVPEGQYKTLILDPVDVFLKDGQLYQIRELHNMLDAQAKRLGCAFILIHLLRKEVKSINDLGNVHLLRPDSTLLLQSSQQGLCVESKGRNFAKIKPNHVPMPSVPRGIISLNPTGDL